MSASSKTVDFSNVKDGGKVNKARIPAGDYLAKILSVEDAKAKDDTFQYFFVFQIQKRPSSKLPYYCKLQENQLWKLRNLLIAAGKTVPKSKTKVDVNSIVGRIIGVTVDDTEYEDKEQSEITGVFPAAELSEAGSTADDSDEDLSEEPEEDEDDSLEDLDESTDEPTDDEEEDEEEAEPEPEMSRAELKAAIKKLEPGFVAKKSQSDEDLAEYLKSLESKPKAATKKTKATKKKAAEVTDDELEELDIDAL